MKVIALIHETGRKGALIAGDLREENSCKQLVARAVEELGGLDIV